MGKDPHPKPLEEVELRKETGSGPSLTCKDKIQAEREKRSTAIMQTLRKPAFCDNSVKILSPYLLLHFIEHLLNGHPINIY